MNEPEFQQALDQEAERISSSKYEIAATGEEFLSKLEGLPPSRALSLAKTKTEEALMWLNKHIYRNA